MKQPVYSYLTCTRSATETVTVHPADIILVEGILIFTDARLRSMLDILVYVDADPDDRLVRVISRDIIERGRDVGKVIERTAFKITRAGQLVGSKAAELLGAKFGIVDLSLAPTPAIGDSVAEILEVMGLSSVGGHGTTAALALLNDAVKKGGVMASSMVGGLSGAFIPVSEDAGMIRAARSGKLTLSKLEAMTAVCSVGLDMIAIPGDTPASTTCTATTSPCAEIRRTTKEPRSSQRIRPINCSAPCLKPVTSTFAMAAAP